MASRVNVALAILLGILVVASVTVLVAGNKVLPWTSAAEAETHTYEEVRQAAEDGVAAFLDVDYRDMDPRMEAVQEHSTGTFKKQYSRTTGELKQAAQQAESVSSGTIRHVGLKEVDDTTATALVAADVVVRNKSTANAEETKSCPHEGSRCDQYRFMVRMAKVGSDWKIAELAGVA